MDKTKYLLWDIDGTLLNFDFAEDIAIRDCFYDFNLGICSNQMLETYKIISKKYWKRLECGELSKKEVLEGRFREFFSLYGFDLSIVSQFNKMFQIHIGNIVLFNTYAEETVQLLKNKYLQYAVTNGTITSQRIKLEKSGLYKVFNDVFISEEIGFEKPSIDFFNKVFQRVGSNNCKEYLIIGDSLSSDIQGGHNAGILTCWFNPSFKKNDTNITADHEIHNLKEVIDILLKNHKNT